MVQVIEIQDPLSLHGQVSNIAADDMAPYVAFSISNHGTVEHGPIVHSIQGVVSLTFRELSKIILRKYTMPEITFALRISSWNFVRVPKAWLWVQVQSFSLQFSQKVRFLQNTTFERISWESSQNVSETTPSTAATETELNQTYVKKMFFSPTVSNTEC